MVNKCPACGSTDVRQEQVNESLPVPYGEDVVVATTQFTCAVCGETGDFTGENDAIVESALKKRVGESVLQMFEGLAAMGISLAYFERALRLPARTTARWKAGELSAAPVSLLRAVRTYPWLLEVADSGFDRTVASFKLLEAAARLVTSALSEKVGAFQVNVVASSRQVNVSAEVRLGEASSDAVRTVSGGLRAPIHLAAGEPCAEVQ